MWHWNIFWFGFTSTFHKLCSFLKLLNQLHAVCHLIHCLFPCGSKILKHISFHAYYFCILLLWLQPRNAVATYTCWHVSTVCQKVTGMYHANPCWWSRHMPRSTFVLSQPTLEIVPCLEDIGTFSYAMIQHFLVGTCDL